MTQKGKGKRGEKDSEGNTDRGLFTRIVEDVIIFAVCCYLVKLGVSYILAVRVPLIIIAVIVGVVLIGYRAWKWRHDHEDF